MDLALSPQDEAFRDEVRRFLDENLTEDLREAGRKTGGVFADVDAGLRWHKVLAKQRLVGADLARRNMAAPAGPPPSATSSPANASPSTRRASSPWASAWWDP